MICTTFLKVGIPEFRELYSICNCGEHVRSDRIGKMMTIRVDSGGKMKEVNLSTIGGTIKKKFKIHELVARTFIPTYDPEKHDIIHIDNNTCNNSFQNITIQDKDQIQINCIFANVSLPGYPSLSELYKICRCGEHVVSNATGNVISQYKSKQGYKLVGLIDKLHNINKCFPVHQLVAHAFLKYPVDGQIYVIDHINRNRQDNNIANLRFATYRENNMNTSGKKNKKPIIQMNMDGHFLKEYDSITQAITDNKDFGSAPICKCLKDEEASAYGFRWKYKNESDKNVVYVPVEGEVFKDLKDVKYYNSFKKKWEIVDFPNYAVSNLGTVINKARGCTVGFDDGNNMSVSLMQGSKRKLIKTHLLVAYMFIGVPSEDFYTVKFKDGNQKNCSVDNLEWMKFRDRCIENLGKEIVAIDPDGVETIFKSMSHASEFLAEKFNTADNYTSGIRACLTGYQESSYGYKWKEYVAVN